jgi:hypothetical protein
MRFSSSSFFPFTNSTARNAWIVLDGLQKDRERERQLPRCADHFLLRLRLLGTFFSSSNILYPADPLRALVCLWPANKKQNTFLLSFYPSIPFFLFSDSYLISYRLGLCFSENPRKEKEEEKIRDFG